MTLAHQLRGSLLDLKGLAAVMKDLQWYTTEGGFQIAGVTVADGIATWQLEPRPVVEKAKAAAAPPVPTERRRVAEPGDQVIVETKGQQMARRFGGANADSMEGTVFRVLTRGPHPHGMKVELRDRTVGRVKRNLTAPGAGEPTGR